MPNICFASLSLFPSPNSYALPLYAERIGDGGCSLCLYSGNINQLFARPVVASHLTHISIPIVTLQTRAHRKMPTDIRSHLHNSERKSALRRAPRLASLEDLGFLTGWNTSDEDSMDLDDAARQYRDYLKFRKRRGRRQRSWRKILNDIFLVRLPPHCFTMPLLTQISSSLYVQDSSGSSLAWLT